MLFRYFKKTLSKEKQEDLKVIWNFYNDCTHDINVVYSMHVPKWNVMWLEGLQTGGPAGSLSKYDGDRNEN